MKPDDVKKLIQDELKRQLSANKYSGSPISKHVHNGLDSLRFPFANLADSNQYIQITRTTLSPAQVKALNTTPITLVPKIVPSIASPRSFNICLGIAGFVNYAGTAYTGTNNLEFRYTDGSGNKVTTDMGTTFLNASTLAYDWAPPVSTELTPVVNAPIVVRVPTANPAAGTSPITFVAFSRIISF